jgi:hypothetical protein
MTVQTTNITQNEIKAGPMSKWHPERPQGPCLQLLINFQMYLLCYLPQEAFHTFVLPKENSRHSAGIRHI